MSSSAQASVSAGTWGILLPSIQKATAASIQSPSSALLTRICVGHLLSSQLLRPCMEPLLLSQETMRPVSTGPVRTRPARLVLGTGMIPPAASLIHTTPVSPDMRGRSIFDSCNLLHLLHHDRFMTRSAAMSITAVRRHTAESVATLPFHTPFTQERAHRNLAKSS